MQIGHRQQPRPGPEQPPGGVEHQPFAGEMDGRGGHASGRCPLSAGERLMLDPAGGLFWPETGLLAVSDLHLEKGTAFARQGMLLPPWDTRATLERLTLMLRRWRPRIVVALGDSFHDAQGAARLPGVERDRLRAMTQTHRFIWVLGNHDPALPKCVGGIICNALTVSGITLRHEPSNTVSAQEIAGHLHPVARLARRGETVRRKCFATDGRRLVMPAFGAYTGGLNVLDAAFGALFLQRTLEAWMLGRSEVYAIGARALLPD